MNCKKLSLIIMSVVKLIIWIAFTGLMAIGLTNGGIEATYGFFKITYGIFIALAVIGTILTIIGLVFICIEKVPAENNLSAEMSKSYN